MGARIIEGLMVVAPIAALVVIAASGRAQSETSGIGPATLEGHRLISAYVGPMRDLVALRIGRPGEASSDRIRQVADRWIALADQGVLRDLPPIEIIDSTREGVKAQIVSGRNSLVHELLDIARRAPTEQAASDYVRAYRLAQVAKHSDLPSVTMTARTELAALEGLAAIGGKLSPEARARARAQIVRADPRASAITSIFRRARALLSERQLTSEGWRSDAAAHVLDRFASLLQIPGSHRELARLQLDQAVRHPETLTVMTLTRLAYSQRLESLAARERALSALAH